MGHAMGLLNLTRVSLELGWDGNVWRDVLIIACARRPTQL